MVGKRGAYLVSLCMNESSKRIDVSKESESNESVIVTQNGPSATRPRPVELYLSNKSSESVVLSDDRPSNSGSRPEKYKDRRNSNESVIFTEDGPSTSGLGPGEYKDNSSERVIVTEYMPSTSGTTPGKYKDRPNSSESVIVTEVRPSTSGFRPGEYNKDMLNSSEHVVIVTEDGPSTSPRPEDYHVSQSRLTSKNIETCDKGDFVYLLNEADGTLVPLYNISEADGSISGLINNLIEYEPNSSSALESVDETSLQLDPNIIVHDVENTISLDLSSNSFNEIEPNPSDLANEPYNNNSVILSEFEVHDVSKSVDETSLLDPNNDVENIDLSASFNEIVPNPPANESSKIVIESLAPNVSETSNQVSLTDSNLEPESANESFPNGSIYLEHHNYNKCSSMLTKEGNPRKRKKFDLNVVERKKCKKDSGSVYEPSQSKEIRPKPNIFSPVLSNKTEFETDNRLTKAGTVRKRKRFIESINERKAFKRRQLVNRHYVKQSCPHSCKLKCSEFIPNDRQQEVNKQYWDLPTTHDRKSFVLSSVSKRPVARRTTFEPNSRRMFTNEYFVKNNDGTSVRVCKTFFLSTLGYEKNNDKILQGISKQTANVSPQVDKRRGRTPANKVDHSVIVSHIDSFEPRISHYRREHAPNRRYLPSDLSIKEMHEDFLKKHSDFKCSYDLYRSKVAEQNISFVKLGLEECEQCEHFNLHGHNKENLQIDSCEQCKIWDTHFKKASAARDQYKQDSIKVLNENEVIYSVDMEKVIMLPRCDMFKSVIFTRRLTVYNECFVPVGTKSKGQTVSCVWHDAIRGRNKEELISTVYKFFVTECRDVKSATLWMDNCSAQNKNWAFLTFLVFIVNSSEICSVNTVHIKYFEPGHSFMSADSFHHRVEKSLNKLKKVYDFGDFTKAVKSSSSNVTVAEMTPNDFFMWKDCSLKRITKKKCPSGSTGNRSKKRAFQEPSTKSSPKKEPLPYLKDISQIQARRGDKHLYFKTTFLDTESWKELNFLNPTTLKSGLHLPAAHKTPVGVSRERKCAIINNILRGKRGIVPENRFTFWENLPEKPE